MNLLGFEDARLSQTDA